MAKRESGWRPESFRAMAVERSRTSMHLGRLCEELGVSPSTLRKWRKELEALPHAEKVLEVDFLQGALRNIEARRGQNTVSGGKVSTPRSGA